MVLELRSASLARAAAERDATKEKIAALDVVYGNKDPALAEIDARSQKAAPMTSDVRAKVAELTKAFPVYG